MQIRKYKKTSDFFGHGSIFQLSKVKFKINDKTSKFEDFYPAADLSDGIKYAVVCTQDCDIEQKKVSHVNIALIEPIERPKKANPIKFMDLNFSEIGERMDENHFYSMSSFKVLNAKVSELLDNTNAQYMFVNLNGVYHFINLTKMFPLKFEHLDQLEEQVQYQLDGSFKHLLGWKIANLYGRVGVPVYEDNRKDELSREIIKMVGKSLKNFFPEKSYEVPDELMVELKAKVRNYRAAKEKNKSTEKLSADIFELLQQAKIEIRQN